MDSQSHATYDIKSALHQRTKTDMQKHNENDMIGFQLENADE